MAISEREPHEPPAPAPEEVPAQFSRFLKRWFPRLNAKTMAFTSRRTFTYNCFAYAARDYSRIWDPRPNANAWWPEGVANDETVDAFTAAYARHGFEVCDGDAVEAGFEKIALYSVRGAVKHAARQMPSGKWRSKIGPEYEDIEHETPGELESELYGRLTLFLKRKL